MIVRTPEERLYFNICGIKYDYYFDKSIDYTTMQKQCIELIEKFKRDVCKEYREALEFYMRYGNDSRNLGIITTKIEKALKL